MQSIELFTGAGGLALGLHCAGFRHRALMDWNRDACDTLRRNVQRSRHGQLESIGSISDWDVYEGDIRQMLDDGFFGQFGGASVDLLAGGVPCQPFSLGGKHRAHADKRDMFPDFVSVVRQLQPRAFIVENVKGLLRKAFSSYFQYTLLRLTYPDIQPREGERWRDHLHRLEDVKTSGEYGGLRYNVVFELLNAADYGVPQTRERVFIVGLRADLGLEWHFPNPTHSRAALAHDQFISGDYWERAQTQRPANLHQWCGKGLLRALQDSGPPPEKPWQTVRDALSDLPEPRKTDSLFFKNHLLREGARSYPGHTGSLIDLPAKTLKAGVHGVPGGENMMVKPDGSLRYFSVREAARLQTFPDDWVLEGSWSEAMRQLGNAVPRRLAQVVAGSLYTTLNNGGGER